MMRVLHVIGPMTVGGAQTQLLGLVKAAHGRLWDATVCATSPGPMVDEFRAAGIEVIELRRVASPGVGRVLKLRGHVRRGRYDVVHANLWQANAYARLAVVGRRPRPRVVISERNVEVDRDEARRRLDRVLGRWTDIWVGNSEAVCDFIRDVHPASGDEVVHIANAVDRSVFHPGDPTRSGGRLRVGSVGRFFPEKGFDVLIDAARLLDGQGFELDVSIAGEGPLQDDLERRADGAPVAFVGELGRGGPVADFLRSLDVFVLPSVNREGRANVLLEAMSCGVATIATDIPGTIETVGRGAMVVPPGDPEALATAIVAAGRDPALADRALEHAATIDDFDELAARYHAVFVPATDRAETA